MPQTLAEVLAEHGLRQLHCAETEKYAHVTYFLNGGREQEWPGESRVLVPSPREVGTYDKKPEMSAPEVAETAPAEAARTDFVTDTSPTPSWLAHTGSSPAAIAAVETADRALGVVLDAVRRAGGTALVTADHGNAETMLEPDGVSPHTAHTTNLVPLVVTDTKLTLRDGGELCDLAPTILSMVEIRPPREMSGRSLVNPR